MKKIIITVVAAFVVLLVGCKEEVRLDHIDPNAPAPTSVTGVTFYNVAGGAVIKFRAPNDPNFLYVKAIYQRHPNSKPEQTNGSNFVDSVVVTGFATTDPATVTLISVGRNQKESEATYVVVTPELSPVIRTYNALIVKKAIGGVRINIQNEFQDDLTVRLIKQNPVYPSGWENIRVFYTRSKEIALTQRGIKSEESTFGISVRDKWGNESDTLFTVLTPVFEEEVRKPFDILKLSGDQYDGAGNNKIECLWDNVFAAYAHGLFVTNKGMGGPLPRPFTIDLKRTVELTRMVMHHRGADGSTYYSYDATSPKRIAVYGTAVEKPSSDINHSDWIKLGEFEGFRPSGLPSPMLSTLEDYQYGCIDGESFEFIDAETGDVRSTPPVRYVRWYTLETWSGVSVGDDGEIIIAELDFFGRIISGDNGTPEED